MGLETFSEAASNHQGPEMRSDLKNFRFSSFPVNHGIRMNEVLSVPPFFFHGILVDMCCFFRWISEASRGMKAEVMNRAFGNDVVSGSKK